MQQRHIIRERQQLESSLNLMQDTCLQPQQGWQDNANQANSNITFHTSSIKHQYEKNW